MNGFIEDFHLFAPENMPKYLIIRFSSIGDIVLTTPVIRCLKEQTEAEVHFLTKKSFKSILEHNPYIEKLYTIDEKIGEVIQELKKEKYDAIIDLHKNIRTQQIKFRLLAKSYAFDKINWQKWQMVNLKKNVLPNMHIVDRYLKTVEPLGVKNDGKGLDYFLPADEDYIQKSISFKIRKLDFKTSYVVFAIGAAHKTKVPTQKMIEEISKRTEGLVVFVGGPAEKALGDYISLNDPNIINTAGTTTLHESAFLIKKAEKVITPDTGMMHVAAAFQKEIISLWGNTIPEFGMTPYLTDNQQNKIFEVKNLSCRPCSKIGYGKCPKGHFKCMNDQDLEAIIQTINS